MATTTLYVLRAGSLWYVGCTGNIEARLGQHNRGAGSAWTRRARGWQLESTERVAAATAGLYEDLRTLELMRRHGPARVRGGRFSQVWLAPARLAEIEHALRHNDGRCLRCGSPHHWVGQCPAPVRTSDPRQNVVPAPAGGGRECARVNDIIVCAVVVAVLAAEALFHFLP